MHDEKRVLKAVEAGFQKQFEVQKLIAQHLLAVIKQQEKMLDMFEEASEMMRDV